MKFKNDLRQEINMRRLISSGIMPIYNNITIHGDLPFVERANVFGPKKELKKTENE
jgi:hypothetical protein